MKGRLIRAKTTRSKHYLVKANSEGGTQWVVRSSVAIVGQLYSQPSPNRSVTVVRPTPFASRRREEGIP